MEPEPDASVTVDAGPDPETPRPPPGGPPPPTACAGPRLDGRVEIAADGCTRVSEGEVIAVEPWPEGDGVRYALHEGFDGGRDVTCTVSVRNVGVDVAEQTAWSVGTIYAGLIEPGAPGELWLGDGDGWWSCDAGSAYPLIVHVGGHWETHLPIFTGHAVDPDWEVPGCVREADACDDFERPYVPGLVDAACVPHVGPSTWAGETTTYIVDDAPRRLRVLRGWQELSCPVPDDDELTTSDFPDGGWVFWSAARPG
jgi:hypothetical protein